MNDTQKLHLLGAKYWPLLSRQKWINSRSKGQGGGQATGQRT